MNTILCPGGYNFSFDIDKGLCVERFIMPPGPPGPPGPTGPPGPGGIPPWGPPGPPPIIPWGGADIGPIGTPPGCDIDMGGIPLALPALPGGPDELFTGGGPTLGGP